MIKDLVKLANHLDSKGLTKEADYLDGIIKKEAKKRKGRRRSDIVEEPKDRMELAKEELSSKLRKYDEENMVEGRYPSIDNENIEYALGDLGEYISYLYSKDREDSEEIFYNEHVVEVIERHYPKTTALDIEDQKDIFTEYSAALRNVYENNMKKIYRGH